MNVKTLIIPLFLVLFCCVFGCRNKQHSTTDESTRDLPQIKDSGELVVLTLYSSTSYFIYRGQEMGFQYELSEQFAKSLGLKLRIEVANSVDEMIQKLLAGEGPGRNEYISRLCRYPLLIIDDFGMERGTDYGLEQVFHVIDTRLLKSKNRLYPWLVKHYGFIAHIRSFSNLYPYCANLFAL